MTNFYLDTSALAKYYLAESGTPWLRTLIRPSAGNVVILCETTPIEIFSLLARRQHAGSLTVAHASTIQANFLIHVANRYLVTLVDSTSLFRARGLVTQYRLRTLDAIQLACALDASNTLGEPITFLSADQDLLTAAQQEGFVVDNPNNHP